MRKDGGAEYAVVRGLTRGLDLLKALNSQEGGRSTLAQLSEGHRPAPPRCAACSKP
jgi:hypothetical protein